MSTSSVLAIEAILEGKGLSRKPAAAELLAGLGARLTRASDLASPSARSSDAIATTVPGLDRLLHGGLPRGGLVEISDMGRRSCGRFSIGIAVLASATASGEAAAFVDLGGHLDPQSAEAAGADLTRLLWVRPARLKEAVASAEMLLATGFPLVVADLGLAPLRGRFVPDAAWVRLERAARAHDAALLLLAPYRISGVRFAAQAVVAADSARAVWIGGEAGSPRLLCGLASRLTLQKDSRARSGVSEALKLSMGDVPLSHPSSSGPAGGRGDFFRSAAEAPLTLPSPPTGGRGVFGRPSPNSPPLPAGEGWGEGRSSEDFEESLNRPPHPTSPPAGRRGDLESRIDSFDHPLPADTRPPKADPPAVGNVARSAAVSGWGEGRPLPLRAIAFTPSS